MAGGEWTLLDERGASAVAFTSFLSLDCRSAGQALSYPVERGGFIHYNKAESPLEIRLTLAAQGAEEDFARIMDRLEEYKREAVCLSVATPAALYTGMTLKDCTHKREREAGAGMLVLELALVQVREARTQVAAGQAGRPKNPSSSGRINTGRTRTTDLPAGFPG
jgi:hypothetical protein